VAAVLVLLTGAAARHWHWQHQRQQWPEGHMLAAF
jgi:hypothetical protein